MAKAVREGRGIRDSEVIIERPDGSRSYVLPHIDPVRNAAGQVVGAVNMLIDLTERRRGEEALRQSGEELRALARHLEIIREEQMARIARELHDEFGQTLTILKLHLRGLQRNLGKFTGERTSIESREAEEIIDGALQRVHELCAELRPPALEHVGLGAALETLAAQFQARSGIPCILNGPADFPVMEEQSQITAYRIVQELLTNVTRHAAASEVRIDLRLADEEFEIEVADNGRGITPQEASGMRSLGVLGMRERALAAGGSMTLAARPGGGTSGIARLPLIPPGETP
jgi:signal transduction histidine kinase